jgi:predicted pyridoxine 5'-phosphate oxidase superfamily flavin-nucleotide-binding protein/ketosteroid isomerase-like protein
MQRVVLEQRLGFAATVCPDGSPNLSPKGTTAIWDQEQLVFADIHSPQTVRNLRSNPGIELNVVDPILRKGFRFKGRAALHREGKVYEDGLRLLAKRGYRATRERVTTIVVVKIETAAQIVSPVYDSGASEELVAAHWESRAAELRERRAPARPGATGGQPEHPNASLVRQFHDLQGAFYAGGPIEPLVELIGEDIRWHVPGRSGIAGDHRGRGPVLEYFKRRRELSRATFRLDVREIVASGDLVFQRVNGTVSHAGAPRSWQTAAVLRVADGQIRECWLLPADQDLFDEIWAHTSDPDA